MQVVTIHEDSICGPVLEVKEAIGEDESPTTADAHELALDLRLSLGLRLGLYIIWLVLGSSEGGGGSGGGGGGLHPPVEA